MGTRRDLVELLERCSFGRVGQVTHLGVSPRPGEHRLVEAVGLVAGLDR